MDIEITIQKDYIFVEPPKGINYWDILEGIGRLMNLDECPIKNNIWEFRDGPVMLLYDDLYKIKAVIKEHYLKKAKRNKTAIVVKTDLHFGIANVFVEIVKDLPCDIRVFSNLRSAEGWIFE